MTNPITRETCTGDVLVFWSTDSEKGEEPEKCSEALKKCLAGGKTEENCLTELTAARDRYEEHPHAKQFEGKVPIVPHSFGRPHEPQPEDKSKRVTLVPFGRPKPKGKDDDKVTVPFDEIMEKKEFNKLGFTCTLNYASIEDNYDLGGFGFGINIPLSNRFFINPQLSFLITTENIFEGEPRWTFDKKTGESKLTRSSEPGFVIFPLGIDLGFLVYKGSESAVALKVGGFIGGLSGGKQIWVETVSSARGEIEFRLSPKTEPLYFGIYLGGGAYFNIPKENYKPMLWTGLRLGIL